MSDAGRTRDPTETMEMDWSHLCKPVDSITRQALTWNPEGKGKEDDRETHGAAIWKQTSKKLATPRDSWRDWLRTGVPGGVMLAAYAPEGAMKALID